MQVGAIQSYTQFTGRNNRKNIDNEPKIENGNSYRGLKDVAKGAVIAMFMIPTATPLMTSCDKEAYAEAWATADSNSESTAQATVKDSCGCRPVGGRDTLIIRDTIEQIVKDTDTVYVKKGYDSPVIDVIRDFFEANDIDLGDGRIPLKIQWLDEQNVPAFYKQLFDGRSSSYNEMTYDVEKTPWNDEAGSFIIGGKDDSYENIRYSLTGDGKLLMMRYIPRNQYKKPTSRGDWMYSNSAVYDINKGKKVVNRYSENALGERKYAGKFGPGDAKNTIRVINPYDTEWRYTNVKVETGDAPEIDD